jgi:hypothetical protein
MSMRVLVLRLLALGLTECTGTTDNGGGVASAGGSETGG